MTWEVVSFEDRADWLAKRRQGIGASDIAGIMGLSPYTTPYRVWASKVYELPEETDDEAMYWGSLLERVILDEWGRRNWEVADRGSLLRHEAHHHFLATPDGMCDNGETGAVVEAKNTTDWRWAEVPQHYRLQVQWQLIVTGYPIGYIAALHAGRQLVTYEIEADPELQAEMIKWADDFWRMVEAGEAPTIEADDNTVMAALWPTSVEQAVEVDRGEAWELFEARTARDTGKARYETATARMKEILKEADTLVVDQRVVATWKGEPRRFLLKGDALDD